MIIENTKAISLMLLKSILHEKGVVHCCNRISNNSFFYSEIIKISDFLGTRAFGRKNNNEEIIYPRAVNDAYPRSLSANYGLNDLPLHVELSHKLLPCRYIVLGCIEPSKPDVRTILLDWKKIKFAPNEFRLLVEAPILVRSGKKSFYSTIIAPDYSFLRYDPCCLEPIDDRGQKALKLLEFYLEKTTKEFYTWHKYDILVIDNWRMLHGRESSMNNLSRKLVRTLINA